VVRTTAIWIERASSTASLNFWNVGVSSTWKRLTTGADPVMTVISISAGLVPAADLDARHLTGGGHRRPEPEQIGAEFERLGLGAVGAVDALTGLVKSSFPFSTPRW